MKVKKVVSLLLTTVMVLSVLCYPLTTSAVVDYTYKIDSALADKLADEEQPVDTLKKYLQTIRQVNMI